MRTEPIVLVHGLGSSFEHGWRESGWAGLIADSGRRVIPVDLLGHGTADAPHDPAEYAHLESSIEQALPSERVDAIGFSLGAQLLLRVAAKTPERIGRLVVIGVGANVFRDDDASCSCPCVRTWRRADKCHCTAVRTAGPHRWERSTCDLGVRSRPMSSNE